MIIKKSSTRLARMLADPPEDVDALPYTLRNILFRLPSQIPALPYWRMTPGALAWNLQKGGYRVQSQSDEILVSDVLDTMLDYYWPSIEDIPERTFELLYRPRSILEFGSSSERKPPEFFSPSVEAKERDTAQLKLSKEVAESVLLAWPVTYPFLWTTYLELISALESVEVIILVPGPNWAEAIQAYLSSFAGRSRRQYLVVDGLIDIWVQDYVPLLTERDGKRLAAVTRYAALCMEDFLEYRELLDKAGRKVALKLGAKLHQLPITLDWGAFVYCGGEAVLASRKLDQVGKPQRTSVLEQLEKHLSVRICPIEADPMDPTGHLDGTVRFIDEETVLLASWEDDRGLANRQYAALRRRFKVIPLPRIPGRRSLLAPKTEYDAFGCYLNYIELPDRLIVPAYGLETDAVVSNLLAESFQKQVHLINCSLLSAGGGGLRCITKSLPW